MMRSVRFLKHYLLLGLIAIPTQHNHAQNAPKTTAGSMTPYPSTEIVVPITVTGFSNIVSLSLHIDYDSRVISFTDAENIAPALSGIMINDAAVSDTLNKIMAIWESYNPVSLTDGAHLFDIRFMYNSGNTGLVFNNTINHGIECEYTDAEGNPLNDLPTSSYYVNGQVSTYTVPSTLDIPAATVNNGDSKCYNATQTITAGGNGKTFTVMNGGIATLIAGHNIRLLPGVRINSGGKLHAYITTTGSYCIPPSAPVKSSDQEEAFTEGSPLSHKGICKIFPNPTSGKCIIKPCVSEEIEATSFSVYSIIGEKILQQEIPAFGFFECSLENYPEGVYLVRVVRNYETETIKLIVSRH